MKFVAIPMIAMALVGCASTRPAASLETLKTVNANLSNNDCSNIDRWVNYAEAQERAKGLLGKAPETLDDDDRLYRAQARIIVWSLRQGCAQ